MRRGKTLWHQIIQRIGLIIIRCLCKVDQKIPSAEFGHHLTADTAGRAILEFSVLRSAADRNCGKGNRAFTDCLGKGSPFCAGACRISGILNVAACEDPSVLRKKCSPDMKMRIWYITVSSHLDSLPAQLFCHFPAYRLFFHHSLHSCCFLFAAVFFSLMFSFRSRFLLAHCRSSSMTASVSGSSSSVIFARKPRLESSCVRKASDRRHSGFHGRHAGGAACGRSRCQLRYGT